LKTLVFHPHIFNVLADTQWLSDNWGWIATSAIVVFGLIIVGFADTRRFSLSRAWAISGVCFDESIRKRVLWITPLAIIGVIGITQFQRAIDEQDAVRQSVKICLFATGLVVIMTSIILACTNLPKEIESRVIYTILTKPTTRLELVLGKVIGFARVSLTMVLIMGIFTWAYMRITSQQKRQQIAYRLKEGDVSDTERSRLTEYNNAGLLTARTLWPSDELNMYGEPPALNTPVRIISNEGDEDVVAGFPINRGVVFGPPPADLDDWAHQGAGQNGLVIRVMLNSVRLPGSVDDQTPSGGTMGPVFGKKAAGKMSPPRITIQLLDENYFDMDAPNLMVGAPTPAELVQKIVAFGKTAKVDPQASAGAIRLSEPTPLPDGNTAQYAYAWLPPVQAEALINHTKFFVRVAGASGLVNYLVGTKPVSCFVPRIKPDAFDVETPGATEIEPLPGFNGTPELLNFRGKLGLHYDQEMNGGKDSPGSTADFAFTSAPAADLVDGKIPFQLILEVDRSNSDVESGHEDATKIDVAVIDGATKKVTPIGQPVYVESRLPAFFGVPVDAITSGDYHIILHSENTGQSIGLYPVSLQLIASEELFELNLLKSLAIIWMMSILVIVLAVFCSTFLSWPIAIVLTVLLLLGHWGVAQVADTSGPGLGRQIVNDCKFTDVAISKVLSTGVDSLTHALNLLSHVLPDTSRFDAIEDIQQGISISSDKLLGAAAVLGGFGISSIVLAYVILLGKEVAP
jgi:hypothetical protein